MNAPPDAAAVRELIATRVGSEMGRRELDRLGFHRDRALLESLHARVREACLWRREGNFPFAGLVDPSPALKQARVPGTALSGLDLVQCAGFLDAAVDLRAAVLASDDADAWPSLCALARSIPEWRDLRSRLRTALLPGGELNDAASPELARIRRRRAQQRQAIEAAMTAAMRRLGSEGALQDEVVTLRNDRYVLPVRSGEQRRAPGIVHGSSSSGQTMFVEPMETIELNNENLRLADEEFAEIHRILIELTAALADEANSITNAASVCGVLDLESAKAAFASDFGAVAAAFAPADAPRLVLQRAAHPLLISVLRAQGRQPVPLDLRLDPDRMLVVSGPNTGGKTVVLKTVAIAVWMAQCGLPVCASQAEMPVFDAIWADVGDVQSIEHNLSTFSSHLVRIREILESATDGSLVLLDELGTATNAAEGAALAIAVAERLRQRRAWTFISTHHDELKAWAGSHRGEVANGSVALDPDTLAPTYQFRFGVPGISAGLDMAARLGLPPDLVADARRRVSVEQQEAGAYLGRLQAALSESENRLAALTAREQEVAGRERALAAHDRTAQQKQMAALRAEMDRRLATFTAAAEKQWKQALASVESDITSAQKRKLSLALTRQKRETAEVFAADVASALPAADVPRTRTPSLADLRPGERINLNDLAARRPSRSEPAPEVETPATLELNLIGERREAALDRLDKFLDDALRTEVSQIRIVHGAGFGVLRQAVADTLRQHPAIARHFHPPHNEGGQGVTIAEFK